MSEKPCFSHKPVLLAEVMKALNPQAQGIYADGTVGGGGHSLEMMRATEGHCTLYAIDRDQEALKAAGKRLEAYSGLHLMHGNFHDVLTLLPEGLLLDGALLDLGVSSWQLDEGGRGFSYHQEAPLDMRMDQSRGMTAAQWLNGVSENTIAQALYDYADERWAARIAKVICEMRDKKPFETTADLVEAVDRAIPKAVRRKDEGHPARRSFQAVRIAVNDEIAPLNQALTDWVSRLKPGGRLCVISFHSIEDRVVKRCFQRLANPCVCPVDAPICVCGRKAEIIALRGYPVSASAAELEDNPRARSAKLRVAERI